MKTTLKLILSPWVWLKNRRLRPSVQKRIDVWLGRAPRPAGNLKYRVFDTCEEAYLLADGQEKYVVSSKDKIIGRSLFVQGEFELDKFFKALEIYAEPTSELVFVDIGANIGSACIPAVNRGLFARAIAIEPDPLNAKLLRVNVSLNGLYTKVEVIEQAAGAEAGTMALFLSDKNFGDHRIGQNQTGMGERKTVPVEIDRLDDLVPATLRAKVFLWIDTQGYEGFVLQGARVTLAKGPPIVLEFCPDMMAESGAYEALTKALLAGPYRRIYDLNEDCPAPKPMSQATFDSLFEKYRSGENATDLLILK